MKTQFKFPSFDSFEEYSRIQKKLDELRTSAAQLRPELDAMEAKRLAATTSRSGPEDQARALLAGDEAGTDPEVPSLEQIGRGRERMKVLDLAQTIAEGYLKETAAKLSLRICQDVRPQFVSAWEALAEALVLASEKATALEEMYAQLDSAGVLRSTLPQALPLESMDARNQDGRINEQVTEIEKAYSIKIARPTLAKAEKLRYELHMERENRKATEKAREAKEREQRLRRRAKAEAEA